MGNGLLGLAECLGVAFAIAGLATLTWYLCRWAAGLVSRQRRDALARAVLVVALAVTVGACERSTILWGNGYGPAALPVLSAFLLCALVSGVVQHWSNGGKVALYTVMVLALTFVVTMPFEPRRMSDEAMASTRRMSLHQLYVAIEQYRRFEGEYPSSLGVLIDSGHLDANALRQFDQRTWAVYWPPRDDTPLDATVAFYWPPVHFGPDEVRTEILFRDGGVQSVRIRDDGSLVNPRTGQVIIPPALPAGRQDVIEAGGCAVRGGHLRCRFRRAHVERTVPGEPAHLPE